MSIRFLKYSLLFFAFISLNSCKNDSKKLEIESLDNHASNLKWIDYKIGTLPPEGAYDAFDSIIKKWNINYERIESGCEPDSVEQKKYEKDNPKYFAELEKKFGKNWRRKFDQEVENLEKELNKKRP